MRIRPVVQTAAVFALAACVPSSTYTVAPTPAPEPAARPAPRSAPRPTPAPVRIAPLEVSVVRSEAERLLVKTNRYAYVALFEVVPGRGVALLHPAPTQRRDAQLSGTSWVNVEWMMRTRDDDRRSVNARNAPERYVYVLASDSPLRITDGSYNASYLRRVLGPGAYEGSDPRATARALSRWFLTSTSDDQWSEDLYAVPNLPAPAPRVTQQPGRGNSGRDHDDNGRRAHGDPANADPRGRGVGNGNGGGRDTRVVQPQGAGRGNAGGRDTPVEQPVLPRLEVDSSHKAPASAQPSSDTKSAQETKGPTTAKDVMNEALRKNGMKPASPAPDSAAKPSPTKKP